VNVEQNATIKLRLHKSTF